MVFQSYALYPHMTVARNLAFGEPARLWEQTEIDRRVRQAASGTGSLLERKPKRVGG